VIDVGNPRCPRIRRIAPVVDRRYEAELPAAARTRKDVELEHTA
jgi:hypothetical protein